MWSYTDLTEEFRASLLKTSRCYFENLEGKTNYSIKKKVLILKYTPLTHTEASRTDKHKSVKHKSWIIYLTTFLFQRPEKKEDSVVLSTSTSNHSAQQ